MCTKKGFIRILLIFGVRKLKPHKINGTKVLSTDQQKCEEQMLYY